MLVFLHVPSMLSLWKVNIWTWITWQCFWRRSVAMVTRGCCNIEYPTERLKFKSWEILSVHNIPCNCPVASIFCTDCHSGTAVVCVIYQTIDWATAQYVMGKPIFARFDLKGYTWLLQSLLPTPFSDLPSPTHWNVCWINTGFRIYGNTIMLNAFAIEKHVAKVWSHFKVFLKCVKRGVNLPHILESQP